MRRCAIYTPLEELAAAFSAEIAEDLASRFRRSRDIGPPTPVLGIRLVDGRRILDAYRWGYIPHGARRPFTNTFDVHVERIDRPIYADAFVSRRLVFVADAYYLWQRRGRKYTGYTFRHVDELPLALAGIWGDWRDPKSGEDVQSCAVITGPANADVKPISDRMPLELARSEIDEWIDPDVHDREVLESMLTPVLDGTYRRSRMRIPGNRL